MCDNNMYVDSVNFPVALYSQKEFYSFVIKQYPWARDYCYYYIYSIFIVRDAVIPVLESILDQDKDTYTPQKAYQYFKKYQQQNLKFVTIIPTCNRPKAIKYLLDYAAVSHRRYGIDIIIYDSSNDNRTLDIVNDIRKNGYFNVIYEKYTGEFDGFSLDHKVMKAYEEYADCYDYIWLCRDGLIPIVDEIYEKLCFFKQKNIDCIIVDTKSRVNNLDIERYYSTSADCEDFLCEQSARLQTLGMLIFSGKLARRLLETEPLREENYSLWQMAAPFHAFAKNPYPIVFCTKNVFAFNAAASQMHFWSKSEKALEQWAYRWYNVVSNMPEQYGNAKEKCMMVYTVDFHPFSARTVLEMRAYGGFNRKILKKYEEYLPKVTMTPLWYFKTIARAPKWMSKFVLQIDKHFHNSISKLRTNIVRDKRD